jgi:hypothetical protein
MLLSVLELRLKLILAGMVMAMGELQGTGIPRLVPLPLLLPKIAVPVPLFTLTMLELMGDEPDRFLLALGGDCKLFVADETTLSKNSKPLNPIELQGLVTVDKPILEVQLGGLFPTFGFMTFATVFDTKRHATFALRRFP